MVLNVDSEMELSLLTCGRLYLAECTIHAVSPAGLTGHWRVVVLMHDECAGSSFSLVNFSHKLAGKRTALGLISHVPNDFSTPDIEHHKEIKVLATYLRTQVGNIPTVALAGAIGDLFFGLCSLVWRTFFPRSASCPASQSSRHIVDSGATYTPESANCGTIWLGGKFLYSGRFMMESTNESSALQSLFLGSDFGPIRMCSNLGDFLYR